MKKRIICILLVLAPLLDAIRQAESDEYLPLITLPDDDS